MGIAGASTLSPPPRRSPAVPVPTSPPPTNADLDAARAADDGAPVLPRGLSTPVNTPLTPVNAPLTPMAASPSLAGVAAPRPRSLFGQRAKPGIRTRAVAILVADGVDGEAAKAIHGSLTAQGAAPRFVGLQPGDVFSATGEALRADTWLEVSPSAGWDGTVVPDGADAAATLAASGPAVAFVRDQHRTGRPILLSRAAAALRAAAGVPDVPGPADGGLVTGDDAAALAQFVRALSAHRRFAPDPSQPPKGEP
jgi:catalase